MAERIRELCAKKKMSQYELAKRAGMTQSSISSLLNEGNVPKITTVEKVCKGFGITLSQFFSKEDNFPDLSEEQLEVLNTWEKLSAKEKLAVRKIVSSILELR
ncbi:HTH-type transcriptional regulator PuuR [Lachnospiraceae bacterium]|nr:HTH-type transcriptional regulator PuuR [Lachnospiraceae bacterium]